MKMYETRTAELTINGIPGTLTQIGYGVSASYSGRRGSKNAPGTWHKQVWVSHPKKVDFDGKPHQMVVEIRYDDECRNGHNSFGITGSISIGNRRDPEVCGCIHGEIKALMPELAPLIKWHMMNSDGPLHYPGNATYHAGDRDCWGARKGEPYRWTRRVFFGNSPIAVKVQSKFLDWLLAVEEHKTKTLESNPARRNYEIVEARHINKPGDSYNFGPKYTFDDFGVDANNPSRAWYNAPFDSLDEAQAFKAAMAGEWRVESVPCAWGEGKERELEKARRSAIWPEATDEQLCLPKDELAALLEARRPALIEAFKADLTAAGLAWEPEPETVE